MKKFLMVSFILLTVSACSNKDLYNTLQSSRMDCLKSGMSQRDRELCNQKVENQMSYDKYSKEQLKL